jgi:hypothetical protein
MPILVECMFDLRHNEYIYLLQHLYSIYLLYLRFPAANRDGRTSQFGVVPYGNTTARQNGRYLCKECKAAYRPDLSRRFLSARRGMDTISPHTINPFPPLRFFFSFLFFFSLWVCLTDIF